MRSHGRFIWRSLSHSRNHFQSTSQSNFRFLRSYSNEVQPQLSTELLNIMEQRLSVIEHRTASLNNILNHPEASPSEYARANKELRKLSGSVDLINDLRAKQKVDVQLKNEDLKVDTYRSGGSGGQHANTTNSAVRVTHIPTGIVVSIQDERSQHMNKAKALKVLCAKLYELERLRLQSSRSKLRLEQIGSGDRSERIRTYNFPQGRVTDHRVGITYHSIDDVMQGENLDVFVDALLLREEMDAIATFRSSQ